MKKKISLAVLKKLTIAKPDLFNNLNFDREENQMFKDSEGNYRSLTKWVLYGAELEDDGIWRILKFLFIMSLVNKKIYKCIVY